MHRYLAIILALLFLDIAGHTESHKVCHTANAGFFIESKSGGILVDTVIFDGLRGYDKPSSDLIAKIETGRPPFDDIALVLISHHHADHFDPRSTLRHMRKNPKTRYVMPPQAFAAIESIGITEEEKARFHTPLPAMDGAAETFRHDGTEIEIYRISHGANRPIENLGYKINLPDGASFFHPGDMATTVEQLTDVGIKGMEVTYLLLPFWVGGDEAGKQMVEMAWRADTIIPTHFQSEAQPWMENLGGPIGVQRSALARWDNAAELTGEMVCLGR